MDSSSLNSGVSMGLGGLGARREDVEGVGSSCTTAGGSVGGSGGTRGSVRGRL